MSKKAEEILQLAKEIAKKAQTLLVDDQVHDCKGSCKKKEAYVFTSFLDEPLTLGLRNNNPGNLRRTKILWNGEIADPENKGKGFERFEYIEYGIRANAIDVIGDIKKDGNDTIEKLISTYAPPIENNTQNYIKFISNELEVQYNQPIHLDYKFVEKLLSAIYYMELGSKDAVKISGEMIQKGVSMINASAKKYLDS